MKKVCKYRLPCGRCDKFDDFCDLTLEDIERIEQAEQKGTSNNKCLHNNRQDYVIDVGENIYKVNICADCGDTKTSKISKN